MAVGSTVDDVRIALEVVAARVPDRHISVDDAVVAAFSGDLLSFPREILFLAARTWDGLRFPAALEFMKHVQSAAREHVRETQREERTLPAKKAGVYRCYACEDTQMVQTRGPDDDGTGPEFYRPCERCNSAAYDRWKGGHYAPNHHCGDCEKLAKSRG